MNPNTPTSCAAASPLSTFWRAVYTRLAVGHNVFVGLVVHHTKHSPGTTGARLWADEQGQHGGTVGGGLMEYDLLRRAEKILAAGVFAPEIQTLHHRKQGGGDTSGMICGGSQTNLYYLCRPERDSEPIGHALGLLAEGASGSLYIGEEGLWVEEKGAVLEQPQQALLHTPSGWRYEEQLLNRKRLAIMGGGHCGQALAPLMRRLGYAVQLFDTRSDLPALAEHPTEITLVTDFQEAGALVAYPELTSVVVMTTAMPSDVCSLQGVVGRPYPFIGVMGSKTKIVHIFEALRGAGVSEQWLESLHAPVGLPIGSNTPEEIAVSIAGQLIREQRSQI